MHGHLASVHSLLHPYIFFYNFFESLKILFQKNQKRVAWCPCFNPIFGGFFLLLLPNLLTQLDVDTDVSSHMSLDTDVLIDTSCLPTIFVAWHRLNGYKGSMLDKTESLILEKGYYLCCKLTRASLLRCRCIY
jgi:hypothetical protein